MPSARSRSAFRWPLLGYVALFLITAAIGIWGVVFATSAQVVNLSKQPVVPAASKLEGDAVWYDVPPNSLARRRAGKGELTAAHNRLPFGTLVRVTHLKTGKNVIVRITDRGITKRQALIDLSKEAAEKLDMLREGSARVRLEILRDDKAHPANAKRPAW
jgi:rare lipoprotein A (peptidoglycan hydrolase)